jgi:hypothetical protein
VAPFFYAVSYKIRHLDKNQDIKFFEPPSRQAFSDFL